MRFSWGARQALGLAAAAMTLGLSTAETWAQKSVPLPPPVPSSGPEIPPPPMRDGGPSANVPATADEDVRPGEQVFQIISPRSKINMLAMESRVLELASRIKVVDGFDQEKVKVTALSPYRVRLHAAATGVTNVKLVDEFDNVYQVEVFVEPDTRELEAYLQRLFPETSVEVVGVRDGVVLRGWVTEPSQIPEIIAISEQFYEIVHPQMTVAGPTQVQLHVKVMEVQRSKMRELGFNFLLTGQDFFVHNGIGSIAPLTALSPSGAILPGGGIAPRVLPAALPNSEIQFAVASNSAAFQGFLHALQNESLAKILSEPVLVTTSGRPATLHSGGEFPVPIPQGLGTVSLDWKQFGVRLEAVPIILGNGRLRLDLAPEVSERDLSTAVPINGVLVPGLTSRSVNTQVEMRFGETVMIGGLISRQTEGTTQKVPFLGELPWIGAAFSEKSFTTRETELVILVTPQMVSPMAAHQVPAGGPGARTDVPLDRELYLDGNLEVPKYGPECPDCEPAPLPGPTIPIPASGTMPAPGTLPPPGLPVPTPEGTNPTQPTPAAPQTSSVTPAGKSSSNVAQRPTISDPFHAPKDKVSRVSHAVSGPADAQERPAQTAQPATEATPPQPPSASDSLPGLIEP